jgi:S1-C subfamily serine protease
MKKVAVACLALAFLCLGTYVARGAVPRADLPKFNTYVEQTNFILGKDTCSATLVNLEKGYLLTAAHCVKPHMKWTIRRDGMARDPVRIAIHQPVMAHNPNLKKLFYTEIVKFDDTIDLAVLKITKDITNRTKPLSSYGFTVYRHVLADEQKIYPAQQVYVIGNPLGQSYVVTSGIVSRAYIVKHPSGLAPGATLTQFDARTNHGNSGGALIDEDGNIIGVVSFIMEMGNFMQSVDMGYNFAISYKTINTFMQGI